MCGKSEISRALCKERGYTYFKNDAERRNFGESNDYFINTLRYGLTYFLSFLRQSDVSVVFDRCYPSEYVYSKAFDRKTDWTVLKECDEEMARLGAVIIIPVRNSYDNINDDTHPHLVNSERLKMLHDLYVEFSHWTSCKVMFLNVDDENLQRELSEIHTFLQETAP